VASEFAAGPDSRKILIINEPVINEIAESNPMSLTSKQMGAALKVPGSVALEVPLESAALEVPFERNVKRARGNQFRQAPEPGAEVS
jgi:hypothetical protein